MSAADFLADHWPDRPLAVTGPVERVSELATDAERTAWLAALVAELHLGFAAHACEHALTERSSAAAPPPDRELIVVVLAGHERWQLAASTHDLVAGTALFVPRATTRAIEVIADARTVTFSFRVPTWAELVANTLLQELAAEPAWRTPGAPPSVSTIDDLRASPPPRTGRR